MAKRNNPNKLTPAAKPAPAASQPANQPLPAHVGAHNRELVTGLVPTARSLKIQQGRAVQNGVTRPSAGGLCAAVWQICDELYKRNNNACPPIGAVRAAGQAKNLNPNNVQIEYYVWRKFMGIAGRQAKAAPPVTVA